MAESSQSRARDYLASCIRSGFQSSTYLLLGPEGSGKTELAWDFCQGILCDKGSCGSCENCQRLQRRSHPDVHELAPQGMKGYVVEQVRELLHDSALAPMQAQSKVYLLKRCDLLMGASANALLKTLEEPPAKTYFVLTARSRDGVLPTILSRCSVIDLGSPAQDEAVARLMGLTGAKADKAYGVWRICGCSVERSCQFLASASKLELWRQGISAMEALPGADDMAVLRMAKNLLACAKAPLEDLKARQEEEKAQAADYLGKGALKDLEERQKRELGSEERACIMLLFSILRCWLEDGLILSSSASQALTNPQSAQALLRLASQLPPERFVAAIGAIDAASELISYTVSAQLVLETMLFDMRKVLACPM